MPLACSCKSVLNQTHQIGSKLKNCIKLRVQRGTIGHGENWARVCSLSICLSWGGRVVPYTWRSSVSNLGDRSLASSRSTLRWSSTLAASTPAMFTRRLAGMDRPLPSLGGALP